MKKVVIIIGIAAIAGASSCKKHEFNELYYEVSNDESSARSGEDDVNNNSSTVLGESGGSETAIPDFKPEEIINISIKEVSDGDDESDGGDDSRK